MSITLTRKIVFGGGFELLTIESDEYLLKLCIFSESKYDNLSVTYESMNDRQYYCYNTTSNNGKDFIVIFDLWKSISEDIKAKTNEAGDNIVFLIFTLVMKTVSRKIEASLNRSKRIDELNKQIAKREKVVHYQMNIISLYDDGISKLRMKVDKTTDVSTKLKYMSKLIKIVEDKKKYLKNLSEA